MHEMSSSVSRSHGALGASLGGFALPCLKSLFFPKKSIANGFEKFAIVRNALGFCCNKSALCR